MKAITLIRFTIGLTLISGLLTGCKKDEVDDDRSGMDVFLAVGSARPDSFTEEQIHLRAIRFHYVDESKGTNGWIELETQSGAYEMLAMQDSMSSRLCATATDLEPGEIDRIRLVFMEGNQVKLRDGTISPVSADIDVLEGRDVKCPTTLQAGSKKLITVEFDARNSVVLESDAGYKLDPKMKIKTIITRRAGRNAARS